MLATELKTGKIYKEDGFPFKVEKYSFSKVARGGATVRVKVRNLITDQVLEKSYSGAVKIEDAQMSRKPAQYLYEDNGYVFMDPTTYDQFTIAKGIIGDLSYYLVAGETVDILYFESRPISIDVPNTMVFEVSYTEPGFKGNTVTNTLKDATLANGLITKVPTFVKIGDLVKIDTRSGEYISKA